MSPTPPGCAGGPAAGPPSSGPPPGPASTAWISRRFSYRTHATSTATKILRFAAGMRQIDKKVYTLQPDWDKLEAEAIRGGKAFNAEIVARLK